MSDSVLRGSSWVPLTGSAALGVTAIASGASTTLATFTVTGAALGDFAAFSYSQNLQGCRMDGYVSAANTVAYRIVNPTAGTVNLAAGTVRARVTAP